MSRPAGLLLSPCENNIPWSSTLRIARLAKPCDLRCCMRRTTAAQSGRLARPRQREGETQGCTRRLQGERESGPYLKAVSNNECCHAISHR